MPRRSCSLVRSASCRGRGVTHGQYCSQYSTGQARLMREDSCVVSHHKVVYLWGACPAGLAAGWLHQPPTLSVYTTPEKAWMFLLRSWICSTVSHTHTQSAQHSTAQRSICTHCFCKRLLPALQPTKHVLLQCPDAAGLRATWKQPCPYMCRGAAGMAPVAQELPKATVDQPHAAT